MRILGLYMLEELCLPHEARIMAGRLNWCHPQTDYTHIPPGWINKMCILLNTHEQIYLADSWDILRYKHTLNIQCEHQVRCLFSVDNQWNLHCWRSHCNIMHWQWQHKYPQNVEHHWIISVCCSCCLLFLEPWVSPVPLDDAVTNGPI